VGEVVNVLIWESKGGRSTIQIRSKQAHEERQGRNDGVGSMKGKVKERWRKRRFAGDKKKKVSES